MSQCIKLTLDNIIAITSPHEMPTLKASEESLGKRPSLEVGVGIETSWRGLPAVIDLRQRRGAKPGGIGRLYLRYDNGGRLVEID